MAFIEAERPNAGPAQDLLQSAKRQIEEASQRLCDAQLSNAEKICDLCDKIARKQVELVGVYSEAAARILGRTVNAENSETSLQNLIRELQKLFKGDPAEAKPDAKEGGR